MAYYQHSKSHRPGRLISWETTPTLPFVKFNTDGSSFGNLGIAGFGGMICDYLGTYISLWKFISLAFQVLVVFQRA